MKNLSFLFLIALTLFNCENESVLTEPEEIACDNGTFVGDVTLLTQQEVDEFGAMCYTKIEGSLQIGPPTNASISEIDNLIALNTLREISANFTISQCPNLNTVDGLESLNNVRGRLMLLGLDNLSSLHGFSGLISLKRLHIQSLNSLESLEGLQGLSSLNGLGLYINNSLSTIEALGGISNDAWSEYIEISQVPQLTSLEVFEIIKSIEGNLFIHGVYGLTNLDGLHNINSVGTLTVTNCINLTSIQGLSGLSQINSSITIDDNDYLESINGLENLNEVNDLYLGNNFRLTNFCALQNILINGTYGDLHISFNAYNPTVQDIIDGNCSQ